jgi:hypothetical protein
MSGKSIYVIPDIHFQTNTSWGLEVGKNFIKWLSNLEVQEKADVILLGDIGDLFLSNGSTVRLFEQFHNILSLKFHRIFIVVGNHDLKLNTKTGKSELVYDYYYEKENTTIIYKPYSTYEIFNRNMLFLPHIISESLKVEDEYKKLFPTSLEPDSFFDYAFGHIALEGALPRIASTLSVDMVPAKYIFMGHLHGINHHNHVESVWACDQSEELPERFIRKITINDKVEEDVIEKIPLPLFTKFENITFPNKIIENNSDPHTTKLYTVYGNIGLQLARDTYPNNHIIKVVNTLLMNNKNKEEVNLQLDEDFTIQDLDKVYEEMKKETKIKVSEKADTIILNLLKIKEEITNKDVKKRRRILVEE